MLKRIERLLPHAAILICNMYIVFFLIDRVNTAMNFIDNGLTKGLLAALCVIGLINMRRLLIASRTRRPAPSLQRSASYARQPQSGRDRARGGAYAPRTERYPARTERYPSRQGEYRARDARAYRDDPRDGRGYASRRAAAPYDRRTEPEGRYSYDYRDEPARRSAYRREGERR